MRYLISFAFSLLLSGIRLSAQPVTYQQILQRADQALQSLLPKFLLPAVKLYNRPYYLSGTQTDEWMLLEKDAAVAGKLKEVTLTYEFSLKQTSCHNYRSLRTIITIRLDSNLNLISHTGIDAIPDFVRDNLPCPFITYQQLKEILRKNRIPEDVRMREVSFNKETRRFEYLIMGKTTMLPADSSGRMQMEMLRLDAETGVVLENSFPNDH